MANDLNVVTLIGRLTRDALIKHTSNGTPICNFSIAVNESFMSNNEKHENVNYIDCQAWGSRGETIEKFFGKGKAICITGSLNQHRWDDDSGNKRSKIVVNVTNFNFLPSNNSNSDNNDNDVNYGGL